MYAEFARILNCIDQTDNTQIYAGLTLPTKDQGQIQLLKKGGVKV